jgi:hypothetical protein
LSNIQSNWTETFFVSLLQNNPLLDDLTLIGFGSPYLLLFALAENCKHLNHFSITEQVKLENIQPVQQIIENNKQSLESFEFCYNRFYFKFDKLTHTLTTQNANITKFIQIAEGFDNIVILEIDFLFSVFDENLLNNLFDKYLHTLQKLYLQNTCYMTVFCLKYALTKCSKLWYLKIHDSFTIDEIKAIFSSKTNITHLEIKLRYDDLLTFQAIIAILIQHKNIVKLTCVCKTQEAHEYFLKVKIRYNFKFYAC